MKFAKTARIVLILMPMYFMVLIASAQPMLPGIAGIMDKDFVLLSWNCQYDGVRSISVKRSADSLTNYKPIGNVKETAKGIQLFTDEQPLAGNNFYKLSITFNSGLSWSSNHCRVTVAAESVKNRMIHQQHVIVPSATIAEQTEKKQFPETPKPISAVRIFLPIPEPDVYEPTFIRSRYVAVQRLTGHVSVSLPAGFEKQQCSIVFYNNKGRVQVEIPEIKVTYLLIDKRNFQRNGIYKFVLKKEGVELESGYITLAM
jgi:hypothetical protein